MHVSANACEVNYILQRCDDMLYTTIYMDFVRVDNYQDKFAFMLLERIEHLEKTITTLEQQLKEIKDESRKKYTPDPLSHLEIFGYTTTFLYFKFPIKYYFVSPESQQNIITEVLKSLIKCFPKTGMSIDVFIYTNYNMQFNVSFDSPIFVTNALPMLHKELYDLRVEDKDNPNNHDFNTTDIVLTRFVCTINKDGDYSVLLTNYMYDL